MTILADRGSKASGTTRESEPPPDLPNVVAAQEHYLYGSELQVSVTMTFGGIGSLVAPDQECGSIGQPLFACPMLKYAACFMS